MWRSFCRTWFKLWGWKAVNGVMPHKKAIIIGVPHTSAWDFVIAYLYYTSVGGTINVIIKKEFFFWPLKILLRKLGAIPLDRSKGTTIVKQIISEMNGREMIHLAITPEGTRNLNKRWKSGFHTIAKATGATVYLGFFDFGRKEVGWRDTFELTDNAEADIHRLKAYYQEHGLVARFSELFSAED